MVNTQRIYGLGVAQSQARRNRVGLTVPREASFIVVGASHLGTVLYFHFGLTAALARKGKE